MPYRNLDEFLIRLEHNDLLIQHDAPVSIDDISRLTYAHLANSDSALWFDNVQGTQFPVVSNIFGTAQRMAWALGVDKLDDLETRINTLLTPDLPQGMSAMMGRMGELLGMMRNVVTTHLKDCQRCVQDVVTKDDIDLNHLPILRNHPKDSHRSITLAQLVTSDDITVTQAQLIDKQTLAIPQYALQGISSTERLPCAIVIGSDPAIWWSGIASLPTPISPHILAGWLRNRPVSLISAITQPIHIPHDAEFALEGWIEPSMIQDDIVFADESGHYIHGLPHITMHITAITHRRDAVYPAYIPSIGEFGWLHRAIKHLYLPILRLLFAVIVDIHFPTVGSWRNLVIVSIDKQYRGHAQQIMHGIWGLDTLAFSKTIIVVNADIDPQDLSAVVTQLLHHVDWENDVTQVKGVLHLHDKSSGERGFGTKIGIDATRKSSVIRYSELQHEALTEAIGETWTSPSAGMLIIQASESVDSNTLCQKIWAIQPDYHILLIDSPPNTDNLTVIIPRILTTIDWANAIIRNPSPDHQSISIDGLLPPQSPWITPVMNPRRVID